MVWFDGIGKEGSRVGGDVPLLLVPDELSVEFGKDATPVQVWISEWMLLLAADLVGVDDPVDVLSRYVVLESGTVASWRAAMTW